MKWGTLFVIKGKYIPFCLNTIKDLKGHNYAKLLMSDHLSSVKSARAFVSHFSEQFNYLSCSEVIYNFSAKDFEGNFAYEVLACDRVLILLQISTVSTSIVKLFLQTFFIHAARLVIILLQIWLKSQQDKRLLCSD